METIEQENFEAARAERYRVIGDQGGAPENCDLPCGEPHE
jgi:hypothetical protein